MIGRLFAVLFLLPLAVIACSDTEPGAAPDGDTPGECQTGDHVCLGATVMRCDAGSFIASKDCGEDGLICHLGDCVALPVGVFGASQIRLDSTQQLTFNFKDPGETYILAPFFATEQSGTTGYSIHTHGAQCLASSVSALSYADADPTDWRGRAVRFEREHSLRERERALWELRRTQPRPALHPIFKNAGDCETSADCDSDFVCETGNCTHEVPLVFDGWDLHTELVANVVAKGEHCAILLDSEDLSAISANQIEDLLDACDRVVVPRSRALFGQPIGVAGEQDVDFSDRNRDGLLHVLLSTKVNDEGVWGFFNSADFWPDEGGSSNERDIIYVSLPENDGELPSIKATLIHEYQHLLHFTIHNWMPWEMGMDPDYSPVWLDEAFAHLAEEIGGYGADNVELVSDFLQNFGQVRLATGADSLKRRAMGMLFMLYHFEQAGGVDYNADGSLVDTGGATFLRAMVADPQAGFASLERVLDRPFDVLFFDWLVTLAAGKSEALSDARYAYNEIIRDPVTGFDIGVITYGQRRSIRGEEITYDGPAMLGFDNACFDEAVGATGAQYVLLPQGDQPLVLDAFADDDAVYLGIIRIR